MQVTAACLNTVHSDGSIKDRKHCIPAQLHFVAPSLIPRSDPSLVQKDAKGRKQPWEERA